MRLTAIDLDHTGDGRVARLVIPGGPLDGRVAAELAEAAAAIVEDRVVRAVVLSASGPDFCSGPADDLDPFALRPDPASALSNVRVPVVAVLTGHCHGVGLEIALAADLRVAGHDASFALDHILHGRLPAWGGSQRLARAIRPGQAVALAMLGRAVDGAEAERIGLVHELADDPAGAADQLAETLIERGPLALEFAKEAVHRGSELPLRDGLRLEGDLNHQLAATEDRAEGLQAFFDKRPPDFGGR
ncbi:MAG: enoyl-CoA hydratase-related protein [Actinomycetota bacterium]